MPESHNRPVGALQLGRHDSDGQHATGNVIFLSNGRKGVVTTWHRDHQTLTSQRNRSETNSVPPIAFVLLYLALDAL
jgi:hypothetical protein